MAQVTIELPSLLSPLVNGQGAISVKSDSVAGALQALVELHPTLRVHLFDEGGGLRQHVFCFHNRTNTRWLGSIEVPVAEGDTITILQAVSGG